MARGKWFALAGLTLALCLTGLQADQSKAAQWPANGMLIASGEDADFYLSDDTDFISPDWSPDSETVAAENTGTSDPSTTSGIYLLGLSGSVKLLRGTSQDSSPKWSPNGKSIAVNHHGSVPFGFGGQIGTCQIVIMRANGTGRRDVFDYRIYDDSALGGTEECGSFAWAPDGSAIAATTTTSSGTPAQIYIVDPTGDRSPAKLA
ncbi:MAG: hypothetical protein NTX07_01350, partial [Solirubrobacterales bacterium]|nr:hypothetical protein [Solirubrobacterales bacterium]